MPKKWYIRIVELLQQMHDTKAERNFDEEEILLYHNLCKLSNTWCKLQETGFRIQQLQADRDLLTLEEQLGIKHNDDDEDIIDGMGTPVPSV